MANGFIGLHATKRTRGGTALLTLALAGLLWGGDAASAQAAEMGTYKAVYRVGLGEVREDVGLNAISGSIAYSVKDVCDAWVLAQSGTMNMHLPSGGVLAQVLHYSSWESKDGSTYRFTVTSEGQDTEVILGRATRTPDGGTAHFTRPEDAEFDLPPGTVFPMAHTRLMLERAQAGEPQNESYLFEGTDVEGAKLVVAFASPLSSRAQSVMDELGGDLLAGPGWNFRLAYFNPEGQTGGEPVYGIEVDMLENGVAPRWVIDYGAYNVEMTLGKIEPEAKPDC